MWNSVVTKLTLLKNLDRQFQVFGANSHRYELRPCVSHATIEQWEAQTGVRLPEAVRRFYLEIGNGIAGPNYGLCPIIEQGDEIEDDFWDMRKEAKHGLIKLIHGGCGTYLCVVTNGPKTGQVVYPNCDNDTVFETGKTLPDVYEDWLDKEIERFQVVKDLMMSGATFEQIDLGLFTRYKRHSFTDYIYSIADTPEPAFVPGKTQAQYLQPILDNWKRD